MTRDSRILKWFGRSILLVGFMVAGPRAVSAATAVFVLNGITWSNTAYPLGTFSGNGLIVWNYTPGDFLNGSGSIVSLDLPAGASSSIYPKQDSVQVNMITSTLASNNVDSFWYDYTINFSPSLTGPNSRANVTGGNYELTGYYPDFGYSGRIAGNITGGSVVPYQPSLSYKKTGSNLVVSWPTNYADGFVFQSAYSLNGSNQWATSSIPVSVVGANYVTTNNITTGTNIFFRLAR